MHHKKMGQIWHKSWMVKYELYGAPNHFYPTFHGFSHLIVEQVYTSTYTDTKSQVFIRCLSLHEILSVWLKQSCDIYRWSFSSICGFFSFQKITMIDLPWMVWYPTSFMRAKHPKHTVMQRHALLTYYFWYLLCYINP